MCARVQSGEDEPRVCTVVRIQNGRESRVVFLPTFNFEKSTESSERERVGTHMRHGRELPVVRPETELRLSDSVFRKIKRESDDSHSDRDLLVLVLLPPDTLTRH